MPSLKDLAKECGVSVATVSKALNGQPDIAPATRERIRAAARRVGYLPNAAARALKTNRTYNLGVLFVDEKQSGLTHEYFSAVLDSFKVEAEKLKAEKEAAELATKQQELTAFAEAQGLDVKAEDVAFAIAELNYAALIAEANKVKRNEAKPTVAAYALTSGLAVKGEYGDLLEKA